MANNDTTLYARIGLEKVRQAIGAFYDLAFEDPLIQHFFLHANKEHIVTAQISFATAMLGGPRAYDGKPLLRAHEPFQIRIPHFRRRQVLMRQVLDQLEILEEDKESWLSMEESLKSLVMRQGHESCQLPPHLRGVTD